jgi:epoxyqueuosine reductase QueG
MKTKKPASMHSIKRITEFLGDTDRYLFGFADMRGLLEGAFIDFPYALSIAQRLDDAIVDEVAQGPTRPYLETYNQVNAELFELERAISRILDAEGVGNLIIKPTFEDDELDENCIQTLRTPFSHKMAATRAGIGWIGKTDLLITERFGPRFRLATILLDCDGLVAGTPILESKCGSCDRCVNACPAQAANGALWSVGVDRDEFYNAQKCRTKCRELTKHRLNEEVSLCGICVAVCPIGRRFA